MIEIGSIVREKDGLRQMTVNAIENGKAECCWFDHNKRLHRAEIPVGKLEIVPPKRK